MVHVVYFFVRFCLVCVVVCVSGVVVRTWCSFEQYPTSLQPVHTFAPGFSQPVTLHLRLDMEERGIGRGMGSVEMEQRRKRHC